MSTVSAYLLYNLSGPDPWRIKHKNHNLLSLNLYLSFSMSVRRTINSQYVCGLLHTLQTTTLNTPVRIEIHITQH